MISDPQSFYKTKKIKSGLSFISVDRWKPSDLSVSKVLGCNESLKVFVLNPKKQSIAKETIISYTLIKYYQSSYSKTESNSVALTVLM